VSIELVPFTAEHVARATTWERDPRVHQAVPGLEPEGLDARMAARLSGAPDSRHFAILSTTGMHVGCASLFRQPDGLSFQIYVGPEHQHHGYGRRAISELLGEAARWAPGERVVIRVFADEPGLYELCEDLGFHRVGHEHARYLGELRPVYVMALESAIAAAR
jgi:RimJ/RimL family protein N-acetyltransferase